MRAALTSQFWNQELESSRAPDSMIRYLAHDPPPLSSLLCSGLSRPQQLLLLQRLLPVPGTPSYAVDDDGAGGWVADRVLASTGGLDWWATLTGRLRVQRLFSKKKHSNTRLSSNGVTENEHQQSNGNSSLADDPESKAPGTNTGISFLDPEHYALTSNASLRLGKNTWLSGSAELQRLSPGCDCSGNGGEGTGKFPWWKELVKRAPLRGRVTLKHKTAKHKVVGDASLNSRCIDGHGCWWTAPHALSLDWSSLGTWNGVRYRAGLHHVGEEAQLDSDPKQRPEVSSAHLPQGAYPGTRFQAGSSWEGEVVLWRDRAERKRREAEREEKERKERGTRHPWLGSKCYSLLASRPKITISGLIGGVSCLALRTKRKTQNLGGADDRGSKEVHLLPRVSAHLFALLGATAQLGLFERPILDHTLVSGHLHWTSEASPLSLAHPESPQGIGRSGQLVSGLRCAPSMAVTLQQQVFGPVRARYDGRFALHWQEGKVQTENLESVISLDCSLEKLLGAARLVLWYSPSRKEGMAELRLLER